MPKHRLAKRIEPSECAAPVNLLRTKVAPWQNSTCMRACCRMVAQASKHLYMVSLLLLLTASVPNGLRLSPLGVPHASATMLQVNDGWFKVRQFLSETIARL